MVARPLRIDYSLGVPAYQQITRHFQDLIASGSIKPGQSLPTIHEVAALADVNPNTAAKAYLELQTLGLIEARRGVGTVARAPSTEVTASERDRGLAAILAFARREAHALGIAPDQLIAYLSDNLLNKKRK
jgi:GntR family transcriptional regulator